MDVALTIVNTGEKKKKHSTVRPSKSKDITSTDAFFSCLHSEPHNYSPISEDPGSMRLSYRKKNKREGHAARVWPLQVSVRLHSIKREPSERRAGDKVSSAKESQISSEILTASKNKKK